MAASQALLHQQQLPGSEQQRHLQQQLFLALKRKEGLLLDVQSVIVGISHVLEISKGLLLLLMVFSQVALLSSTTALREQSPLCLWLCNAAAVLCPTGLMVAFGYICYSRHLRDWPEVSAGRRWLQLLRAAGGPLAAAWICNFAQHFAVARAGGTAGSTGGLVADAAEVLVADSFLGVGPDIMIACSVNFILVSVLWEPLRRVLAVVPPGAWRDGLALALALLPAAATQVEFAGCGSQRWARHLVLCADGISSSRGRTVPALPYLLPFSLGVLLAGCWDRFYAELQPVVSGDVRSGPPTGYSRRGYGALHLAPFAALRRWAAVASCVFLGLSMLFLPVGQQWLTTDFSSGAAAGTAGGSALGVPWALGAPGQPTATWLLGSLWPVAVLATLVCLLVGWLGPAALVGEAGGEGVWLPRPAAELEHLGGNLLYYVTFLNVLLAGVTHSCAVGSEGRSGALPLCESRLQPPAVLASELSTFRCLLGAGGALLLGRFLFAVAARK